MMNITIDLGVIFWLLCGYFALKVAVDLVVLCCRRGPFDRFGYERCGAYRQEDFELCPSPGCHPEPQASCRLCGGYGEISKRTGKGS